MASVVEICNLALGWLGADPITSLEDNSTTANLCRTNYPMSRRAVLEDVQWGFATKRMTLTAQLIDDPTRWGRGNWFPIPDAEKVLVVQRVYGDIYERHQIPGWQKEGDNIVAADYDTIYVRYTYDEEDNTLFSAGFVQALAARIAADLAVPIVQSRELQGDMWGLYNSKMAAAQANEGSQGANEYIQRSKLVRVRGA